MGIRRSGFLAAALLVLSVGGLAHAAPPTDKELEQARALFKEAQADEAAGHFSDALEKLRRIVEVKATPGVRFHIGYCEEKLGHLVEALEAYERADADARIEKKEDVLREVAAPLAALRARVPLLTIHVPGGLPDVRVSLDDKPIVKADWGVARRVAPGAHSVEATAPDHPPFRTMLTVPEKSVHVLTVAFLERAAPAPIPAPEPAKTVEPVRPRAEPGPAREAPARGPSYTGAIVATAATAVLAGLGVGAFLLAGSKQDELLARCPTLGPEGCEALRGPVRTWDAVALGSWIGAGAAGAAAVVLFATAKPSRPSPRSATLIPSLTSDGQGFALGLRGSFQ